METTSETKCPDCGAPSWSGCAYGRCEGCEIDAGCDREGDCRQAKTVEELERSAPEFVEAVLAEADRDRKAADYDRLLDENTRLTRERDEARARVRHLERNESDLHEEAETLSRKWAAAEARAEALAMALRQLGTCLRDDARAEGDLEILVEELVPATLAATPPADLTQHPAYRAGVEAGIEEAAKVCDDWRALYDAEQPLSASRAVGEAAEMCATGIRTLLATKEVRDGE